MGTNSNRLSVRVVVKGRVQGVSFRASMQSQAVENGVEGWVRNRNDGSVEALLQGSGDAVRRVVDWVHVGPPGAEVSAVVEEALDAYPRQTGFKITA